MASFFEKLKRGMGIEIPKEKEEEVEEKPPRKKRVIKIEKEEKPAEVKVEKLETEKSEIEKKEKWPEPEGQLAIDVYQTQEELVVQSAIAGVKPEDLEIFLERDILTIKGVRQKPFEENGDYFTQECYWGPFSREVILPVEVDPDKVEATMKEGILTIRIPKILREKRRQIKVRV